jgi:hypothetical protein
VPDDLVTAAYKALVSSPDVLAVVGQFPPGSDVAGTPYIFQRGLYARLEGTGSTAIVLSYEGGWTSPVPGSQGVYSRLGVQLYADPVRDAGGNVTDPVEVERRARAALAAVDRHFHSLDSDVSVWGDLVLVSSSRLIEPVFTPVPDGGGLVFGQVYYGVVELGHR